MSKTPKLNLRLAPEQRAKLERFAARHRWSLNAAINYLIDMADELERTA